MAIFNAFNGDPNAERFAFLMVIAGTIASLIGLCSAVVAALLLRRSPLALMRWLPWLGIVLHSLVLLAAGVLIVVVISLVVILG